MTAFTQDNIELLAQLYTHGAITMDEFKEAFPKVHDPSSRLYRFVHTGVLRRINGAFIITDKGRDLLASEKRGVPLVAGARRIEHKGTYTAKSVPVRPGADDHLQIPSLMGGQRVYRKDAHRA
jgi:hypothetical protein